jgi:hypothetical protein
VVDPISLERMIDPVTLRCGHSFSERTVLHWLKQNSTCPVCNQAASAADLKVRSYLFLPFSLT